MSNHKSAEKRARQNKKSALRNQSWRTRLKSTIKAFRQTLQVDTPSVTIEQALLKAQRIIQKVASKKVIHSKTASRRISKLYQALASFRRTHANHDTSAPRG